MPPGRVIDPMGFQAHALFCGYIERGDFLEKDETLKRIPFINDRENLQQNDEVIFEILDATLTIAGRVAKISIAHVQKTVKDKEWNDEEWNREIKEALAKLKDGPAKEKVEQWIRSSSYK